MMSSRLGSSQNFVWDLGQELGKGSTCTVYVGRNKVTGEEVAVKVFSFNDRRPHMVKMREFEVLKKLNHRNVVRLLAVENEVVTNQQVMVMEYCDSGSLFSVLEDPANGCGLPESEFLLMVRHVADGMKHLRDNNIIHRDIKPGNILRCLDQDKRYLYKLTDFGAARELPDEEAFTSLYGTEEYLHPDMFRHALINNEGQRQFSAEVDLWSIGVTFYQAATGALPFRSFRGRGDPRLMHQITSQKEPGVISGIQLSENGRIQWSRQLPPTCELSQGLKPLLTRVLAGLMEARPPLVWPFDRFFREIEILTSRVRVDVFCPSTASGFALALDPEDNMSKLKEMVAMETEVKAADQLLVLDGRRLAEWVQPLTPVSQYPPTSPAQPLLVLTRSPQEFTPLSRSDTGTYPALRPEINRRHDYAQAKRCCVVTHAHIRAISHLQLHSALLHRAVDYYCRELERRQQEVWVEWQQVSNCAALALRWLDCFLGMLGLLSSLLTAQTSSPPRSSSSLAPVLALLQETQQQAALALKPEADSLRTWLQATEKEVQQCTSERLKAGSLRALWSADPGRPLEDCSVARAEKSLDSMKRITSFFRAFRENGQALHHNDEQVYKMEKAQLIQHSTTVHTLHKDHCLQQAQVYYSKFQSWFSASGASWRQCEQADLALGTVREWQQRLVAALTQICGTFLERLRKQTEQLQRDLASGGIEGLKESYTVIEHSDVDSMNSPASGPGSGLASSTAASPSRPRTSSPRPQVLITLMDELKDSRSSLEEVMSLVQENFNIMQKFSPPPDCAMPWDPVS